MNNKKEKVLTIVGVLVLIVMLVGATYAYFIPVNTGDVSEDISATSNTTDNLSFSIGNDISFTASESNFYQGGTNVSGSTTATAILTPNNKTNQATMNYYMYLNLTSNPTVYSTGNTNHDAELVLQVFDGSNQLVSLTGLGNQVALGNGYGYDITGVSGLITLLDNHAITANGSATTENWSIVITLVNLNLDQNDNTHKTITGEIVLSKDAQVPVNNIQKLAQHYNLSQPGDITLANGYIYYHDGSHMGYAETTDENGNEDNFYMVLDANDGSYRYSGDNPNNFVCFGSNDSNCPAENLYRIIGIIPVDVVTNSTTNPVTTQTQYLYKLIRNDYETESSLGLTKMYNAYHFVNNNGPIASLVTGTVDAFYWSSSTTPNSNVWGTSELNSALNTNAYGSFSSAWQNKIANVMWKVGGTSEVTIVDVYSNNPVARAYNYEIRNSGVIPFESACSPSCEAENCEFCGWYNYPNENYYDNIPIGGVTEIPNKIGLIYISDYGFAATSNNWFMNAYAYEYGDERVHTLPEPLTNYGYNEAHNWLYTNVFELSISSVFNGDVYALDYNTQDTGYSQYIINSGSLDYVKGGAVRRSFYLTQDTIIDMDNYAGTAADPYRIS